MLYRLWQGDGVAAERHKRSVDRVRIENSARHWFEGSHLLWEVPAYAICDDMLRIKHAREELAPLARRYDTWRAVDHCAAAAYQCACGDFRAALDSVEQGLALTGDGGQPSWVQLAAAHVRSLLGLGRGAEALAQRYVATADALELGQQSEYVRLALALAQAKQGDATAAISGIAQVLERSTAAGITGLNIGLIHETRARVALYQRDAAGFEQAFARASEIHLAHKYPPLSAKCDRLQREAKRQLRSEAEALVRRSGEWTGPSRLTSLLETGRTPEARATLALSLLLEHSLASGGFLFGIDGRGTHCIARSGNADPPATLLELVREYVAEEQCQGSDTTSDDDDADDAPDLSNAWRDPSGHMYRPVMLGHYVGGELVISGVAVLDVSDDAQFVYPAQLAADLSKVASKPGETTLVTQLP